jgi:hypothetical protein
MKKMLSLSFAALVLAAGCGKDPGSPAASTNAAAGGDSLVTAPVDYLSTITKQQQNAVKAIDVAAVNKAIQQFQVEQGRNPKDLNELVEQKCLPQIPKTPHGTRLEYDASTGTVKVVKQ